MEIPTVVTASKMEEKINSAPGIITVVTRDELERFGGTTLKDILERVPGLNSASAYLTDRSMIGVRGDQFNGSNSHVLLLINGRPVREVLEGGIKGEILETFPVGIIERIEVVKGPGSVLYGSGAFAGVINIITEKAEKDEFTVAGMGGADSAVNTRGKVKMKKGDLGLVMAAQYMEKPKWRIPWRYANTGSGFTQKNVTVPNQGPGVYMDADYKGLKVMTAHSEWKNYYFMPHRANLFPAYGIVDYAKTFVDVGYDLKLSNIWTMTMNTTYSRSQMRVESWPYTNRNSHELLGEWTNHINPVEGLGLIVGGLYDYTEGEESSASLGYMRSYALYTQADYRLFKVVKLIGGVQANRPENHRMDFVPRAGVIVNPTSKVSFKALYSQAFRAPTINETSMYFTTLKGTPDLKPEKVSTVDFGVSYQGEKMMLAADYFHSQMTDLIVQQRAGSSSVAYYKNLGEVEQQGFEVEGKYYLTREIFLTGSTLYQVNRDKDANEDVSPIPNFGAKGGVSYKSAKGVTLGFYDIYSDILNKKYDTAYNPDPESYHLLSLNGRLDLDKLLQRRTSGPGIALLMQVDNLLNREIWQPNWGLTPGYSIPVNQGRTLYLGVEVSFL